MIKRLVSAVKNHADNKYFKTMIIFYALSMLTSFFNFLYYPVMTHITSPTVYGEVQFLITIIFQISIVFMALNVITIILSVRHGDRSDKLMRSITALSSLFNNLTLWLTLLAVIFLILNQTSLHFSSPLPFIALGISIISTVPFTIAIGKLQGQESFISAGILSVGGSVLKLAVSATLVITGWGTTGAVIGIGIGQIIAVVVAVSFGALSLSELFSFRVSDIHSLRGDRKFIAVAALSVLLTNIIVAADTVGAKLLLLPHDAGIYAGIATLAKIAIYVVSPLMWLVISSATDPIKYRNKINTIIGIASLLCFSLTILYLAFPSQIVNLLIGPHFNTASHLLTLATLSMGSLAIATLLNVILVASAPYRHIISHTAIIVLGYLLFISSREVSIKSILTGQLFAGILGITYYIAYKFIFQRGFRP